MSQMTSTSQPLGLRERKKIKLRRSVQREALRLFAEQGYDETTVEQIADAADISTTTFYRYFPTKEDVVLDDDYDPILVEHIIGSDDENVPLIATVRSTIAALAVAVETDRDTALARLKLISSVPALRARRGGEGRKNPDFFIRLFSARSGRSIDDYQLRITAAAFAAAQLEAGRIWADTDGTKSLSKLMNDAVTYVEPLIAALEPAPAKR